ncbi:MAG: LOG family protein [Planctomycetota bacterium]
MPDSIGTAVSREEVRRARNEAIAEFLRRFAPGEHEDLLGEMMVTLCRLGADGVDRGDLKILNTALRELRYAFKMFAPYADVPKVTIFGSARTSEDHPQYLQAKKFAELIQKHGWMVITGAGGGIMQAGHHGATSQKSFGVAISLPFEQMTNHFIADDPKLVNFKYFFTRKLMFMKEAEAVALFPGGFGTQDEGFEALTLVQTAKTPPIPIVLCDEPGGRYWRNWRSYVEQELLGHGMIDRVDLSLFHVTDSAEDAVEHIRRFYRRYHSMRYVGEQLVMRMAEPLSSSQLDALNAEFSDILAKGRFEQVEHPLEDEQGAHAEKPRLVFTFDRRSTGRLRALIDWINGLS